MNLTFDETVSFIHTWNSWYLIQHDGYLHSEWSSNGVEIAISPPPPGGIPEEVMNDLKDYTDDVEAGSGRFFIAFGFSACDHQAKEIFQALEPILNASARSAIEIVNFMQFNVTGLPASGESSDGENGTGEASPAPLPPRKELVMKGIIGEGCIDGLEIWHGGEDFSGAGLFLQASRLFAQIERDFKHPKGIADTNPYQCESEEEAEEVSRILGEATDFRPRLVRKSVIETGATPEELAAAVSFVRHREMFDLFPNPAGETLREKRRKDIQEARESLHRSCSVVTFVGIASLTALLWWWMKHGGK